MVQYIGMATRPYKAPHVRMGFMMAVAVIIGSALFVLLGLEHRRTRQDFIDLATLEAQVVLRTVVAAIETAANIRRHLYHAGVDTNLVQEIMSQHGTGRILQRFGKLGMFDYLVCQDHRGIVAGHGISELSSIAADPFLAAALSNGTFATRVITNGITRLEAVQPFATERGQYLLRVAISLHSVHQLEQRKLRRMLLMGGIALLCILLLVVFVVNLHTARVLARERDAITRDVERMQEKLHQQERVAAIERLASGVAHEVRNPLNAIQILVQRMEREVVPSDASATKYSEFMRIIKDELRRMNQIIEEFVRFARAKPPAFEHVLLPTLLRDVCYLQHAFFQKKGVSLVEAFDHAHMMIEADPQQLKQAVTNLLTNALEATPSGGTVTLSATQTRTHTTVCVTDTGCGVPPHLHDKIFDLYGASGKEYGLGLAITRRIIQDHRGTISMRSNSPRGTIVEFTLPNSQHAHPHHR
ncbi:MAG: ATP-binding protein [bacterium]|nr:ATP-binding protein [bacterium]